MIAAQTDYESDRAGLIEIHGCAQKTLGVPLKIAWQIMFTIYAPIIPSPIPIPNTTSMIATSICIF